MKLSSVTNKTKLVTSFVKRLAKTTKQKAVITEIEKIKRLSGASVLPVRIVLENGQEVKVYLRGGDDEKLDVFRIDINGKMTPLAGADFDEGYKPSFDASVDMVANQVTAGQKSFQAKMAKIKVRKPRGAGSAPMNKTQQRTVLLQEAEELDALIATRATHKEELEAQLAILTSQP